MGKSGIPYDPTKLERNYNWPAVLAGAKLPVGFKAPRSPASDLGIRANPRDPSAMFDSRVGLGSGSGVDPNWDIGYFERAWNEASGPLPEGLSEAQKNTLKSRLSASGERNLSDSLADLSRSIGASNPALAMLGARMRVGSAAGVASEMAGIDVREAEKRQELEMQRKANLISLAGVGSGIGSSLRSYDMAMKELEESKRRYDDSQNGGGRSSVGTGSGGGGRYPEGVRPGTAAAEIIDRLRQLYDEIESGRFRPGDGSGVYEEYERLAEAYKKARTTATVGYL